MTNPAIHTDIHDDPSDCECEPTLVLCTFGGYAGSRMQPSEPAEFIIGCPKCDENTDAYGNGYVVTCEQCQTEYSPSWME